MVPTPSIYAGATALVPGGHNIDPKVIEKALQGHPAIAHLLGRSEVRTPMPASFRSLTSSCVGPPIPDRRARKALILRKSAKEDLSLGCQVDGQSDDDFAPLAATQGRGRGDRRRGGRPPRRRAPVAFRRPEEAGARTLLREKLAANAPNVRGGGFATGPRGLGHVAITTRKPEAMIAFWRERFDAFYQ